MDTHIEKSTVTTVWNRIAPLLLFRHLKTANPGLSVLSGNQDSFILLLHCENPPFSNLLYSPKFCWSSLFHSEEREKEWKKDMASTLPPQKVHVSFLLISQWPWLSPKQILTDCRKLWCGRYNTWKKKDIFSYTVWFESS